MRVRRVHRMRLSCNCDSVVFACPRSGGTDEGSAGSPDEGSLDGPLFEPEFL